MAASLACVLGYDQITTDVAYALKQTNDINVIEGPPGVGKSWLAMGIGGLWETGDGTAVRAEGDVLQSDVPFYPLQRVLAGLASSWKTVGAGLAQIGQSGEQILGTAGIITATIRTLMSLRTSRESAHKLCLGDAEQDILFDLEGLSRGRPLLLIADNLHWWDADSLKLLGRLREPRTVEAFPFLADLRLIAVRTIASYEPPAHGMECEALLARGETRYHQLRRPSSSTFSDALIALGAPADQAENVAEDIFNLTGGHLALAARCAKRLQQGEGLPTLGASDDEFVRRLLIDRIRALGALGVNAVTILQVAAVVGRRFRRREVACAMGTDIAEANRLLRTCRDEEVIELSDDIGWFSHDLFRSYFLEAGATDLTSIHDAICRCLRTLRPGDYEQRARHALLAERVRDAASYGVQAALVRIRDGISWRGLSPDVLEAISNGDMVWVTETLEAAMLHLHAERVDDCLTGLDALPRRLPRRLLAEVDYIRATALLATRSEDDRDKALRILEGWDKYEEVEPELGVRLMRLKLYALSLNVDKRPAREVELSIRRVLIQRVDIDPSVEDVIHTLGRSSGSIEEPEVSLGRIHEAVKYYAPGVGRAVVRRPIEYYKCLVNLGAKLITTAAYQDARDVYGRLEDLIADFDSDTFPRLDYPRSGAVLADFRAGAVTAKEAARLQRYVADIDQPQDDPFYSQNALAVYLTLSGDGTSAIEIFDELEDELSRRRRPAPSVLYLTRANRCAVRYVNGDRQAALDEWAPLGELVREIPYVIGRYLVARHDLLAEVMERGETTKPLAFDECLLDLQRFGPFWNQLGRGFRMPEVEWWS